MGSAKMPIKFQPKSVAFVMVATKSYFECWQKAVLSIEKHAFLSWPEVTCHLITDKPSLAKIWANKNLSRVKVKSYEIFPFEWPEITLLRYKFICDIADQITQDFVVYLDADMNIRGDFAEFINFTLKDPGIYLVPHPGYFYRDQRLSVLNIRDKFNYLKLSIQSLAKRQPGLGSWEGNKKSTSYVEPKKRKIYVHGAVWMGYRTLLLQMCSLLSKNIEEDRDKQVMPIWHDESHLNWYFANYPTNILDTRFSGVHNYTHIDYTNCLIETVK